MNKIVAGARRALNTRSEIHPHKIVPGIPANSNAVHAQPDSLKLNPFAVCRYVGIQFTTP